MLHISGHTQGVTPSGKERVLADLLHVAPADIRAQIVLHTVRAVPVPTGVNLVVHPTIGVYNYAVDEFVVQNAIRREAGSILLPYGTCSALNISSSRNIYTILYDAFFGQGQKGRASTLYAFAGDIYRRGAVSRAMRLSRAVLMTDEELATRIGLTTRPLVFSPGVNTEIYRPHPEGVTSHNEVGILLFGGSSYRKNVRAQVLAASHAAREMSRPLTVVGHVPWDLMQHVTSHLQNISDAVVAGLYRDADLVLACPHDEGYGLPALEALASGCLIVATDVPSLRALRGRLGLKAIEGLHLTGTPTEPAIYQAVRSALQGKVQAPFAGRAAVRADLDLRTRGMEFWEHLRGMGVFA